MGASAFNTLASQDPAVDCRYFTGTKPCGKSEVCTTACFSYSQSNGIVLLVHLGALGAVVRSTALLAGIKRKHPGRKIFWLTDTPGHHLLQNHPDIDAVFSSDFSGYAELLALEFEAIYVVDKSLKASGLAQTLAAKQRFGFSVDPQSAVIKPQSPAAKELYQIGLDDGLKFFQNKKTEIQLVWEALELGPWTVSPYNLPLTSQELVSVQDRRRSWLKLRGRGSFGADFRAPHDLILGWNTGCSDTIPAKKLSVQMHRDLIQQCIVAGYHHHVLLGGASDTKRNLEIAKDLPVIVSSTETGLRDGLVSVAACDLVITGDSLGMHMSISQRKYVVAWFGPTCAHEIELYGWGRKVLSKAQCGPCWKRTCHQSVMCYDLVSTQELLSAIFQGAKAVSQASGAGSSAQIDGQEAKLSLVEKELSFEPSP